MNVFTRSAAAGAALALTGLLAACSGDSDAGQSAQGNETPGDGSSQGSSSEVSDPKDVGGAELCSLLPPDATKSLGLKPEGELKEDALDPDAPKNCEWQLQGGGAGVSITAFPDRPVESYYQKAGQYQDFAKLNIAGYPAVRANEGIPAQDGGCAMFAATQEGQVLGASAILGANPEQDPCAMTKQALEAAIPQLPATK